MIEIGSADAAVVCGVSPHTTPWQWWARTLGLLPPPEVTEAMRRGLELQAAIVGMAARARGWSSVEPMPTLYSIARPWQRATPDAIAFGGGGCWLVEVKALCQAPPDAPRADWVVQVQHQLDVARSHAIDACGLIVAFGALELRCYDVAYHPGLVAGMLAREAAMCEWVATRNPPPVAAADARWISAVYPQVASDQMRELPAEALGWDRAYQTARVKRQRWQLIEDQAKACLCNAIGSASAGRLPDGTRYTYTTQRRAGWTVEPMTVRVLRRCATSAREEA